MCFERDRLSGQLRYVAAPNRSLSLRPDYERTCALCVSLSHGSGERVCIGRLRPGAIGGLALPSAGADEPPAPRHPAGRARPCAVADRLPPRSIRAGQVRIGRGGERAAKPCQMVPEDTRVEIEEGRRFVSRGGLKLEAVLDAFEVDVTGARCLDVGASTGGFTDCLLQRGRGEVIALDVGTRPARLVAAQRRARDRHRGLQRPRACSRATFRSARPGRDRRQLHRARQGARAASPPASPTAARSSRWSSRSSSSAAAGWARAAWSARREDRRDAVPGVVAAAGELGLGVLGRGSGRACPGRRATGGLRPAGDRRGRMLDPPRPSRQAIAEAVG